MGKGYYILVWDDWGLGLSMINPRLLSCGQDDNGNPINWFGMNKELSDEEIVQKHKLNEVYKHFKIIR